MVQTDRGAGPVFLCDHCGERITEVKLANYVWDDKGAVPGDVLDVYFVHKGDCDRALEARLTGGRPERLASMELNVLLPYLASNLGVDWEEAQQHAGRMDMFD
jgi:hypothetical protein